MVYAPAHGAWYVTVDAGASRWYESVEEIAQVGHVYAMGQEHFPLLLVRHPKGWTFPQAWPQLKRYN